MLHTEKKKAFSIHNNINSSSYNPKKWVTTKMRWSYNFKKKSLLCFLLLQNNHLQPKFFLIFLVSLSYFCSLSKIKIKKVNDGPKKKSYNFLTIMMLIS